MAAFTMDGHRNLNRHMLTCMCMYLRILYTFNPYLFPTNCRDSVQAAMEEDAPGLLQVFPIKLPS